MAYETWSDGALLLPLIVEEEVNWQIGWLLTGVEHLAEALALALALA